MQYIKLVFCTIIRSEKFIHKIHAPCMNDSFTVFPLHGFEEVSYEVGMAESVGICKAISYLLSLFCHATDLVSVLFGDLSWDTAIPTSIHF